VPQLLIARSIFVYRIKRVRDNVLSHSADYVFDVVDSSDNLPVRFKPIAYAITSALDLIYN